MDGVESCDPFAKFRHEAQRLEITAQAKLSEYLQRRAKEEREDKIISQKFDHQRSIAEMQLRGKELENVQRHEAHALVINLPPPRVKLNLYHPGDDVDAFIARFERMAALYKMEAEEMAIEFFSLFSDKALQILPMLPPNMASLST